MNSFLGITLYILFLFHIIMTFRMSVFISILSILSFHFVQSNLYAFSCSWLDFSFFFSSHCFNDFTPAVIQRNKMEFLVLHSRSNEKKYKIANAFILVLFRCNRLRNESTRALYVWIQVIRMKKEWKKKKTRQKKKCEMKWFVCELFIRKLLLILK